MIKNTIKLILFWLILSVEILSNGILHAQNDTIKIDSTYLINEAKRLLEACLQPKPKSIISLYINGGVDLSKKKFTEAYYTDGQLGNNISKSGLGFLSGIGLDYHLNKGFDLNFELFYSYKSLASEVNANNYSTINLKEKQKWIGLPLVIKYSITNSKIQPYLQAGISFEKLIANEIHLSGSVEGNNSNQNVQTASFSDLTNHKKNNSSLIIGCGVKLNHYQDYFFIDLRYSYGLINQKNKYNTTNNNFLWSYHFYETDYILKNLYFSFGFAKTIFSKQQIQ